MSGAFAAAAAAAGGLSAGAAGGGDGAEAADEDEAANVGTEGSIGLDAEGSLNVRFSTAAWTKQKNKQTISPGKDFGGLQCSSKLYLWSLVVGSQVQKRHFLPEWSPKSPPPLPLSLLQTHRAQSYSKEHNSTFKQNERLGARENILIHSSAEWQIFVLAGKVHMQFTLLKWFFGLAHLNMSVTLVRVLIFAKLDHYDLHRATVSWVAMTKQEPNNLLFHGDIYVALKLTFSHRSRQ